MQKLKECTQNIFERKEQHDENTCLCLICSIFRCVLHTKIRIQRLLIGWIVNYLLSLYSLKLRVLFRFEFCKELQSKVRRTSSSHVFFKTNTKQPNVLGKFENSNLTGKKVSFVLKGRLTRNLVWARHESLVSSSMLRRS